MARILAVAFFNSPEEGKRFWPLLEPLRQQNHEITLLTNAAFAPESNKDIEIWGLFEKGSVTESLKLVPTLFKRQFDVVHFFHFRSQPVFAYHTLFWIFVKQPHVVMASSLMADETEIAKSGLLKLWLENSDIVTGFSRMTLAEMRTLQPKSKWQCKTALPPLLTSMQTVSQFNWTQADEEFLEETNKQGCVLVPHFPTRWKMREDFWQTFSSLLAKTPVAFVGTQNSWSLKERRDFANWSQDINPTWLLTGDTSVKLHPALVIHTKAVWMAGVPLSSFDVVYWLSAAFSQGKPVVVDSEQAQLYPELLRSQNSWCMILPKDSGQWPTDWKENLEALTPSPSWGDVQQHADAKINDLSRLYQKALGDKA